MDDIEAVIDASKHFKYHEPSGTTPFNRMSSLPESKKHLKYAIKERIQLLATAYISLATFIDDDLVEFLEEHRGSIEKEDKEKTKDIYENVMQDMTKLTNEIKAFDPMGGG